MRINSLKMKIYFFILFPRYYLQYCSKASKNCKEIDFCKDKAMLCEFSDFSV